MIDGPFAARHLSKRMVSPARRAGGGSSSSSPSALSRLDDDTFRMYSCTDVKGGRQYLAEHVGLLTAMAIPSLQWQLQAMRFWCPNPADSCKPQCVECSRQQLDNAAPLVVDLTSHSRQEQGRHLPVVSRGVGGGHAGDGLQQLRHPGGVPRQRRHPLVHQHQVAHPPAAQWCSDAQLARPPLRC